MKEPILRAADLEAWALLEEAALAWSETARHRRAVVAAKEVVRRALDVEPRAAVMWSGGKDSTAMAHLIRVEVGADVPAASEKDDLDYPGEEEHVVGLAREWGMDLQILRPPISPAGWMADHGADLRPCADLHGRRASMSKLCFYDVVEEHGRQFGLIFLGLRQEESAGRRANRMRRGLLYRRASGQWTSTPIADWSGMDVYAYHAARAIPMLPAYHCIAFMHAREPWTVRKSWWVPGAHAATGGAAWLHHYYPRLYDRLVGWVPTARLVG